MTHARPVQSLWRRRQCTPLAPASTASCRCSVRQGLALAKRLHDDAVGRGAIMALAPGLAVPAAFTAAASSVPVRAVACGASVRVRAVRQLNAVGSTDRGVPEAHQRHEPVVVDAGFTLRVLRLVRIAQSCMCTAVSGPHRQCCVDPQALSAAAPAPTVAATAPVRPGITSQQLPKQPPSPQRRRVQGCSPHEAAAAAAAARAAASAGDHGAATDGASQVDDAVMAQLMDMGYSAQKACKVVRLWPACCSLARRTVAILITSPSPAPHPSSSLLSRPSSP